jgi:Fe-S cluster assembly scaffold protein SufB
LIEDLTFDLFYEKYGNGFTEQQVERWSDLRQRLEKYYDRLPKNPDPRKVLDDPEWEAVRQSARRFVEVFSKPDDNARELLK